MASVPRLVKVGSGDDRVRAGFRPQRALLRLCPRGRLRRASRSASTPPTSWSSSAWSSSSLGVIADGVRSAGRSDRPEMESQRCPSVTSSTRSRRSGSSLVHVVLFAAGAYFAWRSFGAGASHPRLGLLAVRPRRDQLHDLPPRLDGHPVRPHDQRGPQPARLHPHLRRGEPDDPRPLPPGRPRA